MSNYEPVTLKDGKIRINFALFKNDNRTQESHPQAKSRDKNTGIAASAWTRQTKTGDKFQSCVLEIPMDRIIELVKNDIGDTAPQQSNNFDDNSDLPF
jgi:uncharacterized protein (DUF736 family)